MFETWLVWDGTVSDDSLQRLVPNSSEITITTAAISPDGKYFAYSDGSACYVLAIESRETITLPPPLSSAIIHLSWFPDSTRLLITNADESNQLATVNSVSILSGGLSKDLLHGDVGEASISVDNTRIAYTTRDGNEVWVQQVEGGERWRLFAGREGETFRGICWTRNGKLIVDRVWFGGSDYTISVELLDPKTRRSVQLMSDPRLRGGCMSPDGHLMYSLATSRGLYTELWSREVDLIEGRLKGRPLRHGRWKETAIYELSTSTDARKVAFLKGAYQGNVFIAELARSPRVSLTNVRKLTLDESNDFPTAWTPDGRAVVFHSDREKTWQLFEQGLGQAMAKPLLIASGDYDYKAARFSPDHKSLLFLASLRSRIPGSQLKVRLMQMPAGGGIPKLLATGLGLSFRCPIGQANNCVLCEGRLRTLTFSALDPNTGELRKLITVNTESGLGQDYWDVSPDGRELAIAVSTARDSVIRIFNLRDGSSRQIVVHGHTGLQSIDWAPDGSGWFVSSRWSQGADLLYIDGNGNSTVLRRQPISFETWGLPNIDGRHLAFLEWDAVASPWLMTN